MYTFGHISVKQLQWPVQVDSGPWIVQLCENNSGLNSHSGWHLTPSHAWSNNPADGQTNRQTIPTKNMTSYGGGNKPHNDFFQENV